MGVAGMPVDTSTLLRESTDGLGIGNGMSGTLVTSWLHQAKRVPKSKKRDRLITLGDRSARDIVGRAIVIHEGPDSWGQPTGDAGARLGCGIIKLTRAKKQIKKFKR